MKRIRSIHIPENPTTPVLLFFYGGGYVEMQATSRQYRRLLALYEAIKGDWNHPRYTTRESVCFRAIRCRRRDEVFDVPAGTGTRGLAQVSTPAPPQLEVAA